MKQHAEPSRCYPSAPSPLCASCSRRMPGELARNRQNVSIDASAIRVRTDCGLYIATSRVRAQGALVAAAA